MIEIDKLIQCTAHKEEMLMERRKCRIKQPQCEFGRDRDIERNWMGWRSVQWWEKEREGVGDWEGPKESSDKQKNSLSNKEKYKFIEREREKETVASSRFWFISHCTVYFSRNKNIQ